MLKNSCESSQEKILSGMPLEDQTTYEQLFELNMNYWQNFSECEKRIYELIVLADKEIGHETMMNIFNS